MKTSLFAAAALLTTVATAPEGQAQAITRTGEGSSIEQLCGLRANKRLRELLALSDAFEAAKKLQSPADIDAITDVAKRGEDLTENAKRDPGICRSTGVMALFDAAIVEFSKKVYLEMLIRTGGQQRNI